MKILPPDAAEFVANYYSSFSTEICIERKIQFFKDIIATFEIVGIYEDSNDQHPVSWAGQRTGKEE